MERGLSAGGPLESGMCVPMKKRNFTTSLTRLLFLVSFSSYQSLHKTSTKGIKEIIPARLPAKKEQNFPLQVARRYVYHCSFMHAACGLCNEHMVKNKNFIMAEISY